jgi:hypothetical protein
MTTGLSELPDFAVELFPRADAGRPRLPGEQAYFVEKLRLRNRCLHGYGGVRAAGQPDPAADPATPALMTTSRG